jgi:hypothetical protein
LGKIEIKFLVVLTKLKFRMSTQYNTFDPSSDDNLETNYYYRGESEEEESSEDSGGLIEAIAL